jgi:ABC-type Fe3+-citrate transport system substrate-binding protein
MSEIRDKMEDIKEELEKLDVTVDRQWEDYYEREKISPVERIAKVISKKEELRSEFKKLKENLESRWSAVEEVQE